MALPADAQNQLVYAKQLLDNPGFATRLTASLGAPLENAVARLPPRWAGTLQNASRTALTRALDGALLTLDAGDRGRPAANRLHRLAVTASGAAGGAFGLAGLSVELPLTTTLLLRSIADVARSEGENLNLAEARLACIEVFALGGSGSSDDAAETGYYAVRVALARLLSEAAEQLAARGVAQQSAPALLQFIGAVAARFGIVVSEKAAAQLVPLLGAAGGAAVNNVFISHFQSVARGHFVVRRLEREYGSDAVRRLYRTL